MNSPVSGPEKNGGKLKSVDFKDFPVVDLEDLSEEAGRIRSLLRRPRMPSFGGFIVREAGAQAAADFVQRFCHPRHQKLTSIIFGKDGPLHTDLDCRSRVTALSASRGRVEAMVLVGAKIHLGDTITDEATLALFNDSMLHTNDVSSPYSPLRGELNEGDMLVFDPDQPHAIRSLSEQRQTIAYFPAPR